jgi:hypothetical protein
LVKLSEKILFRLKGLVKFSGSKMAFFPKIVSLLFKNNDFLNRAFAKGVPALPFAIFLFPTFARYFSKP